MGDGAVRPGGPGGGSEGREGHVRRATAATRDGGAQGRVSVPEGAVQTLRGENLAAAAGRARVEVRGENRRVFQMRREGAEGRDANARRERVPGRGGTVRVRGVRVRAQGATGGVPSALEGVLREHLRPGVLDNDKNTTGTKERGGIGGEGDVDTDATVGSKDGFRAMHTRHELTRRDVRVVAETIRESTAAAEENLAIIRDDARRAADERDDAARRFALEMDAARHDFARRAKEVETLVDSSESELTDALANLWAESSDSRRWGRSGRWRRRGRSTTTRRARWTRSTPPPCDRRTHRVRWARPSSRSPPPPRRAGGSRRVGDIRASTDGGARETRLRSRMARGGSRGGGVGAPGRRSGEL